MDVHNIFIWKLYLYWNIATFIEFFSKTCHSCKIHKPSLETLIFEQNISDQQKYDFCYFYVGWNYEKKHQTFSYPRTDSILSVDKDQLLEKDKIILDANLDLFMEICTILFSRILIFTYLLLGKCFPWAILEYWILDSTSLNSKRFCSYSKIAYLSKSMHPLNR